MDFIYTWNGLAHTLKEKKTLIDHNSIPWENTFVNEDETKEFSNKQQRVLFTSRPAL
jgi:hypothetical protein